MRQTFETQSTKILRTEFLTLSDLEFECLTDSPERTIQAALGQSSYIVANDEPFQTSLEMQVYAS